jgi:uncharacterized Tic20 family protein
MSHPHHAHPSEVPDGQRLAAALTHLGGIFFLFVPAGIVWLQTRRDPVESWLAHQAKEALNFQFTATALFCICAMLSWTLSSLGFRLFPLVVAYDWVFALIAVAKSALGERYVYPFKIHFIK